MGDCRRGWVWVTDVGGKWVSADEEVMLVIVDVGGCG